MSKQDILQALSDIALFRFLNVRELELLALVMKQITVSAGDTLCREGEAGSTCFFIASGVVDVHKRSGDEDRVLTTLREGQMFGHLALVDSGPRTATCIAATTASLLVLERNDFDTLFNNNTRFAFKFQDVIARTAAEQLRLATERLSILMGQSVAHDTHANRSAQNAEHMRNLSSELSRSAAQVKFD